MRTIVFALLSFPFVVPPQAGAAEPPAKGAPGSLLDSVPPGVVDGPTARRLVEAGAVVVDVRTPQEFAAGHVPGARNIPHGEIRTRAAEVGPPGTPVLLYCATGRRSGIAADELKRLGYDKLWDMQRYTAWPAERSPQ